MGTVFKAFSCEMCAGNVFEPPINGVYRCSYCGTNHILVNDALIRTNERNEFFGAAEGFMELKKYNYARDSFNRIIHDWPTQSRAWWGLVICMSERFTKIKLNQKEYDDILDKAECAIKFASPQELPIIQYQWNEYSQKVLSYIKQQNDILEADEKQKAEQAAYKERKKQEEERIEKLKRKEQIAKQNALNQFSIQTKAALDKKERSIKTTMIAVSVITFIIINLIYAIIVFSLNIVGSIYNSPACIAPVVIGGLVSMVISGLACGVFDIPSLSYAPAVINAICVVMMIMGMLSHTNGFFMSALVIICFGAVGMGVTALIGWLGNLIGEAISKEYSASTYARNRCHKEYQRLFEEKQKEIGL